VKRKYFDRRGGERGAVLAMVCVIIVVVIGCAAFAVDAGAAWEAKRRIRTATDAAALAAAGVYASGGNGCASTDDSYLNANDSAAAVTNCSAVAQTTSNPGRVTVTGERPVDFHFAQIFGVDGVDVRSSTTARYGNVESVIGLRPMGLCLSANPALETWMNLPTGPTTDSGTIRIIYSKSHPTACGENAPGNWGMLDFNGGSNSNSEARDWVANGYPGQVSLYDPTIPGDTGSFSQSIDEELASLVGTEFGIPVFDEVSGTGANTEFRLVAFVKVELVGFEVQGAQADRYLDLQFKVGNLAGGGCCGGTVNTGARAIDVCAVDESFDVSDCNTS
jgi:Flp pilus assembly protein TadG